ncbi:sialic acid-binding Ig-like lectin 14 [Pungitius pungitius]|uniref:sialic acid-binding Ig-like lectin 14 n=1 Tax=Pungitius pungitius TaxID=134920 RepID=UPI002E13250F
MFVLICATLLFSVRRITAATGSSVEGKEPCKDGFCVTFREGEVKAEAGLCVVIPCSFKTDSTFVANQLVFYKCDPSKRFCADSDTIFHSNKSNKVQSGFMGRVSLLQPDLKQKNCSIIINDLTESDSGSYQLRLLKGNTDTYQSSSKVNISVKGLTQKPTVGIPPLAEGQQTTLSCTAPGLCSGSDPEITWTWRGAGEKDCPITGSITAVKTEHLTCVTRRRSSTLTFNPSAEHHGTNVTCKVSFTNNITTEETVTLNVTYLLYSFFMSFTNPQVLIAFSMGILSATVCCLALKCCRNKRNSGGMDLQTVTTQAVPLMDPNQAAGSDGTHGPGGDVEYSDIDFSSVRRKRAGGAEGTQETPDTEYAEINIEGTEERQSDGAEDD